MALHTPGDQHRHAIVGQTGSGKTTFGLWMLSRRSFDKMPWIIVDAKRDDIIADIPHQEEIDVGSKIPKHPGLYVVRPTIADFDEGRATTLLYRLHERGKVGLFIDEGYAFKPNDRALRAVLTQGRSKRIPVIALSQRPAWVSPFIFSESEFRSIFFLDHPPDVDRVQEWLPRRDEHGNRPNPENLPRHHSYWYCGPHREFRTFGPCPDEGEILDVFDRRKVRSRWPV